MSDLSCSSQKAFTLVELIMVVVIIGVLTGVMGPRMSQGIHKAKSRDARTNLFMLQGANSIYRARNGDCNFPQTVNATGTCVSGSQLVSSNSAQLTLINNMNGNGSLNLVPNGAVYTLAANGSTYTAVAAGCTITLNLLTNLSDSTTACGAGTNPSCVGGNDCP